MRKIKVLGVPFHFGQKHEGVKRAPEALIQAGLLKKLEHISYVDDLGDVDFSLCKSSPHKTLIKNEKEAALGCELISQCIEKENLKDSFLLNIGGDHGMALGTIHGVLAKNPNTIVIWADAHGDINSPMSSPSGNFHGMPLYFLLGGGKSRKNFQWIKYHLLPQKLIYFGPRDLDLEEKKIIQDLGIIYFSSSEINLKGGKFLMEKALDLLDPEGIHPLHLSFDVDVFDATDIVATGTRVEDGPNLEEIEALAEVIGDTGRLRSMDIVEINPDLGYQLEVRRTLKLSTEFIVNCLERTFQSYRQVRYAGLTPMAVFL